MTEVHRVLELYAPLSPFVFCFLSFSQFVHNPVAVVHCVSNAGNVFILNNFFFLFLLSESRKIYILMVNVHTHPLHRLALRKLHVFQSIPLACLARELLSMQGKRADNKHHTY